MVDRSPGTGGRYLGIVRSMVGGGSAIRNPGATAECRRRAAFEKTNEEAMGREGHKKEQKQTSFRFARRAALLF